MSVLASYEDTPSGPGSRPIRQAVFISVVKDNDARAEITYAGKTLTVPVVPGRYVPGGLVFVQVDDSGRPRLVTGAAGDKPVGFDEDQAKGLNPVMPKSQLAHGGLVPEDLTEEEKRLLAEFPKKLAENNERLDAAEASSKKVAEEAAIKFHDLDKRLGATSTTAREAVEKAVAAETTAGEAKSQAESLTRSVEVAADNAGKAKTQAESAQVLADVAAADVVKAQQAATVALAKAKDADGKAQGAVAEAARCEERIQDLTAKAEEAQKKATAAREKADKAETALLGFRAELDKVKGTQTAGSGMVTLAYRDPGASDMSGRPEGALWYVWENGTAKRLFQRKGNDWEQIKMGPEFIGANAITSAHIGYGAIGRAEIADGAITNAKIGNASISYAKLDSSVANQLWVNDLSAKVASAQRVIVAPGNLVPNGQGYKNENLSSSWRWQSSPRPDGTGTGGSWRASSTSTVFIGNSDSSRIPVVGGESYVWSWRAYASPGRNYKTAYRWRDAAGKDIGYYYVGSTRYASTSWTYESEVLTAPSTAATLELVWLNISGYGLTLADITVKAQAGAIDIRDGVVTAPKLQAGSIGTRELTANEIRGKTFVGSTYYAADTSSTWNNVKIDSTGVHVYQGGKEMVRLSSDTGTGLSVRSPVSDEMLPLASYVFGSKTFIEGAPVWPSDSGQWHFYDFPGSYQAVARNNMISFGTLISNDTYHVMGTPYFTDQQTGERFEVGKPHRVGIVPITFSQPRALEPGHTYTVGTQYRIIGRNPYPQAPGNPAVSPRIVEIRPIE